MPQQLLLLRNTALGTADPQGRVKGLLADANVLMPNLSPLGVRKQYQLYDGKICTGHESAECIEDLKTQLKSIDRYVVVDRGDVAKAAFPQS